MVVAWQEGRCQAQASQCRAYYATRDSHLLGKGINSNAAEQQAINSACEPNGYSCRLFSAASIPTWLLVFVGIGGILAAVSSLRTIQKQTEHAATAANAALLNAQAVINSERPWIFIPFVGKFPRIWPPALVERLPGVYQYSECCFWFKNFGKSPARVIEFKRQMKICTKNDIPPVTVFDPADAQKGETTIPHDTQIPILAGIEGGQVSSEDIRAVEIDFSKSLWICGYVKYVDTFSLKDAPTYETRFCYRWANNTAAMPFAAEKTPFWVMDDRCPDEYNRAT